MKLKEKKFNSLKHFSINKLFAALLISLFVVSTASLITDVLIVPHKLKKNILEIKIKNAIDNSKPESKNNTDISILLKDASSERGSKIFRKCTQCHAITKDKNMIGPSLWGIVGRNMGAITNYVYSDVLKSQKNLVWDIEKLNIFIYNPRQYLKGTKMSFLGLESNQERADLILYLQTLK